MTTTHTHVVSEFANPYLRCLKCHSKVKSFVAFDGQVPECDHKGMLFPCHHDGIYSLCPSWSPVDGCNCIEHLGHRYHELDKTDRHR